MKIAFVGKGGSGKSTLTSLFIRHLESRKRMGVLAIDADLNMNLAGLLGVEIPENSLLARPDVAEAIRWHLRGNNERIKDAAGFLPTTPPGRGSNLINDPQDRALQNFAVTVSARPPINLLTVGSYDRDGIGQTCYHSHLFVAENILSHTISSDRFAVVCDMVAGTDAFAYSMHLQFDAIILIAEPTPESLEVCRLYFDLAVESGVDDLVFVVGNKVDGEEDLDYIREKLGREPLGTVPFMRRLKRARQLGNPVTTDMLEDSLSDLMETIEKRAIKPRLSADRRLELLHKLHLKLNEKKWVQSGYGDVAEQIDFQFRIPTLQGAAV